MKNGLSTESILIKVVILIIAFMFITFMLDVYLPSHTTVTVQEKLNGGGDGFVRGRLVESLKTKGFVLTVIFGLALFWNEIKIVWSLIIKGDE